MIKLTALFGIAFAWIALFSTASAAPKAAVWSPDKVLAGQLAPAAITGSYELHPPKGYAAQAKPGPDGAAAHSWVGPPQSDGIRPYVMLMILTPPASEAHKYTVNQISAHMLNSVRNRRTDWKQSPSETGIVNGLAFVRTYWRGTDKVTGQAMRGLMYIAQDGNHFVQLSSQDEESSSKSSLALAEASALTFKKR